jgi:hypothetical protein
LFACFFAVELFTTVLTVRATYLILQPEQLHSSAPNSLRSSVEGALDIPSSDLVSPGLPSPVHHREYTLSQMLGEKWDGKPPAVEARDERMILQDPPRTHQRSKSGTESQQGYFDAPVPARIDGLQRASKSYSDSSRTL